jgi:hypothetical protein
MPKSPALAFLMGMLPGALLATIIVLHIVTNQVQAGNAAVSASIESANAETQKTVNTAQKVIAAWQSRAETCEAKFAVGTIVYQKQPLASFPILHGLAAFNIVDVGESKPSLYIPAQVDIYTDRTDVRYQWFDGHSGAPQGITHIAQSPSAVQ